MNATRSSASSVLFLIATCMLSGCSENDVEMAQVTGQITYNGKPVSGLFVTFHPLRRSGEINAPTRQAMGETDSEGRYSLSTKTPGDGAAVGKHRVVLAPIRQGAPMSGKLPPNFEAEVLAGENTIDMKLLSTR